MDQVARATDDSACQSADFGHRAVYYRPGIEGAHEKGGVEGQVGYFRRNHFVPVLEVASLTELNAMVDQWDQDGEERRLRGCTRSVGEAQ
ncbi:hypothetical protein ACFU6I_25420 [Streptomyces sp. NPDC057486]|uniref:hypothetical protein n=1 Tax=Streptomyces sp. NPDC057486 TaxID=3346145 RepID=UPI003699ED62